MPPIDEVRIRPLEPEDNAPMAAIIRASLAEFGVDKPGTVFTDPTTDDLYRLFRTPRSHYMTAWSEGRLLGGAGIFPSAGLPPDTCDLILLVDVYHEFSHPVQMLAAMRKALKPEGQLVLVEFRAEDDTVPIRPEHKMSKRQVIKEYTANGFKVQSQYDGLPWQHLMFMVRDE